MCKRHPSQSLLGKIMLFLAVESFCTNTVPPHKVEDTVYELYTGRFTMRFVLNMPKSTISLIIGSSSSESNATDPILCHG